MKSKSGKNIKKGYLPEKPCQGCGKPMIWRKKWARDWDQVKFCSDRCRAKGAPITPPETPSTADRPRRPDRGP